MTPIPLKEVLSLNPGTVISGVRGTVKAVCERFTGEQPQSDNTVRKWSLQDLILNDNGTEVCVKVANHEPIPVEKQGQSLYLLAHQKSRGGMSGLKVDEEEGQKVLRVSQSGELVWGQPGDTIAVPMATGAGIGQAGYGIAPVAERITLQQAEAVHKAVDLAAMRDILKPDMNLAESFPMVAKSVKPHPNIAIEVDRVCAIYEAILRRVLLIRVSDNDGCIPDPQQATETIFKAILSRPEA